MKVVGIDPGTTGAMALFNDLGELCAVLDLPVVDKHIDGRQLRAHLTIWNPDHVMVELTHAMPRNGSMAAFSQGDTWGAIRTAVECANIPYTTVLPTRWKKALNLPTGGMTDAERKERSRSRAIGLFPGRNFFDRKKDHNRAEAALIGLYAHKELS